MLILSLFMLYYYAYRLFDIIRQTPYWGAAPAGQNNQMKMAGEKLGKCSEREPAGPAGPHPTQTSKWSGRSSMFDYYDVLFGQRLENVNPYGNAGLSAPGPSHLLTLHLAGWLSSDFDTSGRPR